MSVHNRWLAKPLSAMLRSNKTHAADVLQTMHVILLRSGFVGTYADPLVHLACLLAAAGGCLL